MARVDFKRRVKRPARFLLAVSFLIPLAEPQVSSPESRSPFGRDMVVEKGETLEDATCQFCSIQVRGTLTGDAVAVGGTVEVSGAVVGDVVVVGGGVRLAPGAKVDGDVVVVGGSVERAGNAPIGGEITSLPWIELPGQRRPFLPGALGNTGISLLVVSLFFMLARLSRIEIVADAVSKRYLLAPLVGLVLAGMAVSLLSLRIPHGGQVKDDLVLLVVFGIFGLGSAGAGRWVGRRLAPRMRPFVATLLGVIAIDLLSVIPFLGLLVFTVFSLIALGAPVISGFGKSADWRPWPLSRSRITPI